MFAALLARTAPLRAPGVGAVVVIAGTVGLFAAASAFVARFGSNCPQGDEWYLLADVLRAGFSWAWLVEHHNEHRYVTAKLLWYGLLGVTGFDFRAGMVLTLGLLGTSVALLLAAARRGGRWTPADLFLPVILLHWGHWFAWLMSYQIAFSLVVLCAAGFVWAATRESERTAARLASVFLGLTVLNGGFGLGFGGPMILWAAYAARRQRSIRLAIVPALAAAYLAFVLATTPDPVAPQARPNALGFLHGFILYLASGFGHHGFETTGSLRVLTSIAAVALPAVALMVSTRAAVLRPRERAQALGLVAALAGHLAVAGSVAWYRGEGQGHRFVTPSAVGLAVAWVAVRRSVVIPRAATAVIALAAAGVYGMNVHDSYWQGENLRQICHPLVADVERGRPVLFLSGKYGGQWQLDDIGGAHYAALRDAQVGIFRHTPPDPAFVAIPVNLPAGTPLPAWDPNAGPPKPAVLLPDPPRPVMALRVRVEQTQTVGWQEVALVWTEAGVERRATAHPPTVAGQQHPLVFPTTANPTNVRLEPASPITDLKIVSAEWLAPPGP